MTGNLNASDSTVIYGSTDSISATITLKPFDSKTHKITFNQDGKAVEKINGKRYSGTDGTMPTLEIWSIAIIQNKEHFNFPNDQFDSLFEVHKINTIPLLVKNDQLEFELSGGDAAGSFRAKWNVNFKKRQIERLLYEFRPDLPEEITDDAGIDIPTVLRSKF